MTEMGGVAARAALNEFLRDLDKVDQLLQLIYVFRDFAKQEEAGTENAHDLWVAAQKVRIDLPILSGSMLLYLCGRFEYFVRELVGTIVDDLVDKVASYDELPDALRKEHLTRTLSINENPGKYNYTPDSARVLASELAINLSGDGSSGSALRVDSATITITESNMKPGTLVNLLKRVNINAVWDTLGKQLPLKSHFSEPTDAGCKKAAEARLEEIMNERNKVAHPVTGGTIFPDVKWVEDAGKYFRVLAQELTALAIAPR